MSSKTYVPLSKEAERPIITKREIKRLFRSSLDVVDCDDVTRRDDLSVSQFRDTYLYQMLFSKYFDGTAADESRLRSACIQKWLQCEFRCKNTNYRLANRLIKPGTIAVLERAASLISEILGPAKVSYLADDCSWGPGATTRLPRTHGDAVFKFDGTPHVTSSLLPFAEEYTKHCVWTPEFEIRDYANFMTVRKNAITDRSIDPQPDMCLFFQKSLGNTIRRKMKGLPVDSSTTLDLNSQEVNRRLARLGSIDGRLATIDLSSASDLISLWLVRLLLDERWFHLLYICRVGKTKIDDTMYSLEKFSAMGNGFTWELQSLIFYAITRACYDCMGLNDQVTAVFGDDIICRTEIAPFLYEVLDDLGLQVNQDKSYISGFFRESCGKHYYKGADVSPFFVRRPVTTSHEVAKLHNRLVEWQFAFGYRRLDLKGVQHTLAGLIKGMPFSKPVPLGFGDVGLISCKTDLKHRRFRYRRQHVVKSPRGDYTREGHLFRCHTMTKSIAAFANEAVLVKALFCKSSESLSASEVPFGNEWIVGQYCNTTVWPELGCWL